STRTGSADGRRVGDRDEAAAAAAPAAVNTAAVSALAADQDFKGLTRNQVELAADFGAEAGAAGTADPGVDATLSPKSLDIVDAGDGRREGDDASGVVEVDRRGFGARG